MLAEYLAKSCAYAQAELKREDLSTNELEFALEITSSQVSCFLAQNTRLGSEGVEWDIVHSQLCAEKKDEAQWKVIIDELVKKLGGMNDVDWRKRALKAEKELERLEGELERLEHSYKSMHRELKRFDDDWDFSDD